MCRVLVASAVLVFCIARGAAAQAPSGPVSPKPLTASSYEKVLDGLIGNGADDRLWGTLTPEGKSDLIGKVNELQGNITVQLPVGPVAPKPLVPVPPKPKPGPIPPPTLKDFEKSLDALKTTLEKATKADPAFVLTAPVNSDLQQLIEKLSNVKRQQE